MADILRPMGIPPKVDILEQQVGGEEQILGASLGSVNGAIVSDPKPKVRA